MRRLWPLALTAALWGCPDKEKAVDTAVVDAGPLQLVEKEPNDQPDSALQVSGSAVITANMGSDPSKPDEDWYVLATSSPKTVRLTISAIAGGDVAFEFQDRDRNRMATVNSQGLGQGERVPNVHVKDRVYFKVYPAKKGAGGEYVITVQFEEPISGFELEPNDRAVDGTPMPLGQSVQGYLGHVEDQDWYRFDLPQPEPTPSPAPELDAGEVPDAGEQPPDSGAPEADAGSPPAADDAPKTALRIELSGVEGVRYEVQVLSAAEAPLFEIKGKDGEGLQLRNVGVRASDQLVYVVVKSAWTGTGKEARRTFNPEQSYTLTVAQEEAGANAELEPNGDRGHGTALPLDGFREGFVSPKGDVDYFVLRASEPLLARVQLSGVERMDLQLSMVGGVPDGGEADQELLRANDGALKEPELLNNVFCQGECFFKVEGARKKVSGKWVADYENAELPYRLSVTTLPDNGTEEREPNNLATNAMPVTLGKPVRGTVYPKKDVDLFKLDLSERPVKTPIKATLLGILKVDVGLYLHQVDDEGKLTLVQTADRAKGDKAEVIRFSADPGVYLLEVRDSRNRESNFQDSYQLVVEEGS